MKTKVVFKDGAKDETTWTVNDSPSATLDQAVKDAEKRQGGKKHDGAWLEFTK